MNITLKRTNSQDPDFLHLVGELDADLRATYDQLMNTYDQHNVIEQIETVVIAYADSMPAGCGCFKKIANDTAELKRMYVKPSARGNAVSAKVLSELENWAQSLGYRKMILETGHRQIAALGLYKKAGYLATANYGPYIALETSLCFSKLL